MLKLRFDWYITRSKQVSTTVELPVLQFGLSLSCHSNQPCIIVTFSEFAKAVNVKLMYKLVFNILSATNNYSQDHLSTSYVTIQRVPV